MEKSDIIVVGGGIGGLALAQGLVAAGVGVRVFERGDHSRSRLQGYRLSLSPDGLGSLKALLPAERWREVASACTAPIAGVSFLSQRLEPRFFVPTPPPVDEATRHSSIARATLREILLRGIEEHVVFGHEVVGYDESDPDHLVCRLSDGGEATCRFLVGADGTGSVIRARLLGASNRYDTGVLAVSGKVPADREAMRERTSAPIGGAAVVMGDQPLGMFVASHWLDDASADQNYVFWALVARRERFPEGLREASSERLVRIADQMTEGWHPRLVALVHDSDASSVMALDYASSRDPGTWDGGRVTLLGDAIHNMPPTGGQGANMALRDAAALCRAIVDAGGRVEPAAVRAFETDMRRHAFAAVAESMTNLARMVDRA